LAVSEILHFNTVNENQITKHYESGSLEGT